jgi:hypothetical protein
MFMRLFHSLAAIAIALAPLPALAEAKEAVLNKEGYWGIDVDNGSCAASMTLQGGAIFLLRGHEGQVTFGLFSTKGPIRRGKAGRIQTEAYGVDFEPSYGENNETLYYNGDFDARALAALRLARQAQILIDGKPVASMTLEGTGFEGALDGVVACSKGESGWWGKGVGAAGPEVPLNREGIWSISLGEGGGHCVAEASAGEGVYLQFPAVAGRTGIAVATDEKMRRGRRGRVEVDGYAFDFKPGYGGSRYFVTDAPLDAQALFTLRRSKSIRISVDRKVVVDVSLEGSGFPQLLDDLAACARGEKGWWGEGARQPS